MIKVLFDEYGECTGPHLYCDRCEKPINAGQLKESSYFWKAPTTADEAERTIAVTVHNQCIQGYILDHTDHAERNDVVAWQAMSILEQSRNTEAPIETYYSKRGML